MLLFLGIWATNAQAKTKPRMAVVFVVDTSGNRAQDGERLLEMAESLDESVKVLLGDKQQKVSVGVVGSAKLLSYSSYDLFFDQGGMMKTDISQSRLNWAKVVYELKNMHPLSQPAWARGLREAIKMLEKAKIQDAKIVLIGAKAEENLSETLLLADYAKRNNIQIYSIGYGFPAHQQHNENWDEQLPIQLRDEGQLTTENMLIALASSDELKHDTKANDLQDITSIHQIQLPLHYKEKPNYQYATEKTELTAAIQACVSSKESSETGTLKTIAVTQPGPQENTTLANPLPQTDTLPDQLIVTPNVTQGNEPANPQQEEAFIAENNEEIIADTGQAPFFILRLVVVILVICGIFFASFMKMHADRNKRYVP